MHGAIARMPRLIASCTTGVAKSTSQVVKITLAPLSSRLSAHDLALAGLLFWVSQVMIFTCTPPRALICLTRTLAAASAGLSKGAMLPLLSKAQPIVIAPFVAAAAVPVTETPTPSAATTARSAPSAPLLFTFTTSSCAFAFTCGAESRTTPLWP